MYQSLHRSLQWRSDDQNRCNMWCIRQSNRFSFKSRSSPWTQGAEVLLEALLDRIEALLANIAFTAKARLLDRLEEYQVEALIPNSNQKQSWEFDQDKYRLRHLIENFFAKLKQYRGIVTRYDKRACAFLGAIHWAVEVILLNWWQALVKDIFLQKFFSFIRTDDENRQVRRSISGDTNEDSWGDVKGEEADARVSSILAKSVLLENDCTNLNLSEELD